ncbi:hypothetical protein EON64_14555, partial [archaeon]
VGVRQLMDWGRCPWGGGFMHSADAPHLPNLPCAIFSDERYLSQARSVSLTVLVCVEMLRALSAVSSEQSLIKLPPWANPVLLPSVLLPLGLHVLLLYLPPLNRLFKLAPLRPRDWAAVAALSLPVILLEEALKLLGRRLQAREREMQQQCGKGR